jgi:hypothetical protein
LIARLVVGSIGATDVGRKGDVAEALELAGCVSEGGQEPHPATALGFLGRGKNLDVEGLVHVDASAGTEPAPRTHHGLPDVVAQGTHEEHLGLASARAGAQEAGGKDAAAIGDHEVAGSEEVGEVAKGVVAHRRPGAVEDEQARSVALGEGLLGDRLVGKRVVEIGGLQNSFFWGDGAGGTRPKCS